MFITFNLLSARPIVLPCATPHKANTGSFMGTIFHVNYLCPQLIGPHLATNWLGLGLDFTGYYPKVMSRSSQGHLKVKQAKILNKKYFYSFLLQRSVPQDCSWHIVAGKPSNTHPRGYGEYYGAWRGNTPLLYPPSPFISHPLPTLKSMQKMVNWSLVEHGLEVTKYPRHP